MSSSRFLKELFRAFIVGTLIYLAFLAYYYFTDNPKIEFTFDKLWKGYYTDLVFSIVLYMANMYWFFYLLKKWDYAVYTYKRLTIAIIGNIVVSFIGIFVSRLFILVAFYDNSIEQVLSSFSLKDYQQPLLITLLVALIFYAFFYYKYRQDNKVKEQKMIAGTASARFDALKNQLDPHFLFNSLNVLTSLIEEDPNQAQKFTTSLSKVYRYVLEQKNKDLVTVDEELNFARTYVRLLKMRFEDSIVFEIPDAALNSEAKIVPLSLQLLLENAVKHNVVTSSKPLHIKVFEENGSLIVKNNLQEKQVVKKSSGVGLQNIKQRYNILSDKKVHIAKTSTHFSVALPMLSQKVSFVEAQESHIEEKRYEKAKERVEAIKNFYSNLFSYCIVIPFLWWLNYRTTSFTWAIFPTIGWGFGLIMHGLEAFAYNPLWGKRWEEKKIKELMEDEDF